MENTSGNNVAGGRVAGAVNLLVQVTLTTTGEVAAPGITAVDISVFASLLPAKFRL